MRVENDERPLNRPRIESALQSEALSSLRKKLQLMSHTHPASALSRIGFSICVVLALAACQQTAQNPLTSKTAPFADEPFSVRRINRDKFDASLQPTLVLYVTDKPPGTIVVDTQAKHLYLVKGNDQALRFGVAVGAAGKSWRGKATIGRKSAWPVWYPTDDMRKVARGIPARIPPGEENPLGARALYLYQGSRDTLYRIHGTSEPWTIGTEASSGCIRMFNEDIIVLYDEARIGAEVYVQ